MPIRLDARLAAVAELASGSATVCDVGCDHGKLACWLVETGRAERAIATDISLPSLKKAEVLAEHLGVSDLVETRAGDGLDPVRDGEADTVVIAGMGGDLIARILERAHAEGKRFGRLVLSPNTHPERVREQLGRQGHEIVADTVAECGGKAYTVIATREGEGDRLDGLQLLFGKFFASDEGLALRARKEIAGIDALLKENPEAAALAGRKSLLEAALKECEYEDR